MSTSRTLVRAFVVTVATGLLALGARAAVIPILDPGSLGATDHVSWDQLGVDGTSIAQAFSAVSTGGQTVGGAFAGPAGGKVCDPAGGACASSWAFGDFAIVAGDGSGGNGTGPLTLTFASGVSAVGTYVLSDAAFQNYTSGTGYATPFSASLALYNGTTLLDTVTGTSDDAADPFYLGAKISGGPEITGAVYTVTAIGQPGYSPPDVVTYSYDANAGHTDPPMCYALPAQLLTILRNVLQCPQKATLVIAGYASGFTVTSTLAQYLSFKSVIATGVSTSLPGTPIPSTIDTNPGDLAALYINTVDFIPAPVVAIGIPEPHTFPLVVLAVAFAGLNLRRRGSGLR